MSFIDPELLKAFEGRFLRFADGVTRELRLVGYDHQPADEAAGRKYPKTVVNVIDEQTGEAKSFDADFGFIKALTPINEQIGPGDILIVTPKTYMSKGKERLNYDIYKKPV